MKVHLRMLGCRLNQSEIDSMARQFEQIGHEITDNPDEADWHIVNTCAVTNEAAKSSRKLIRELHRTNENAQITVTGCYAQIAPQEIQVLPGVVRVVDNQGKDTLVEQISGVKVEAFDHEPIARENQAGRTRAFIKVQDGCDNACTFCITTVARGDGRSRSIAEVVDEIRFLHESGYQEAVLTGVHLGSFGHDFNDHDGLKHLVQAILADTDMPRVRLSSLEPWDLSDGFFDLWADTRVQPHLHLPLQSGNDKILKRMRRNTTKGEFSALVYAARQAIPDVNITTDVIVGFPGETEEDFAETRDYIEEIGFSSLHVFPYSVRSGTPAARMRGHLPKAVKKARVSELLALSALLETRYGEHYVGDTRPVLYEHVHGATEDGFMHVGYTDNYVRVQTIHPRVLTNHIVPSRLDAYDSDLQIMNVTPLLEYIEG